MSEDCEEGVSEECDDQERVQIILGDRKLTYVHFRPKRNCISSDCGAFYITAPQPGLHIRLYRRNF